MVDPPFPLSVYRYFIYSAAISIRLEFLRFQKGNYPSAAQPGKYSGRRIETKDHSIPDRRRMGYHSLPMELPI